MTTNADRTRDVLLNNFDNATAEIARMMDIKDVIIRNQRERLDEMEHELSAMREELTAARGLPI